MLKTSGMTSRFWEEAVATACYLQNRTPHQGIEGQVPYTMLYGYPPEISHLRVFGATTVAYIQPAKRTKLEDRCIKGKLIGYGEPYGVKAYRIYLPDTGKIIFSRSVEFDEKSLFSRSSYVMKETGSGHLTKEITKLRLPQATTTESENDETKSENSPNERMIVDDNQITTSSSTNPLPSTQSSTPYIQKFEPLQHNNEGKHMEG